jgi:hypothetical protein
MNDYITAQAIAREHNVPCWELFGCDRKINTITGYAHCKGDCTDAIERYKEKLGVKDE